MSTARCNGAQLQVKLAILLCAARTGCLQMTCCLSSSQQNEVLGTPVSLHLFEYTARYKKHAGIDSYPPLQVYKAVVVAVASLLLLLQS